MIAELLTASGEPMELSFARGNVGTLVDVNVLQKNEVQIPQVVGGGGNIFISPE